MGDERVRILTPRTQRSCAPLVLRVVGVPPRSTVRLTALARDRRGRTWSSEARIRPADTIVDIARDPAVAGCYRGVDPDGLVAGMRPVHGRPPRGGFVPAEADHVLLRLAAAVEGGAGAVVDIRRVRIAPGVTVHDLGTLREARVQRWEPRLHDRRPPPVVVLAEQGSQMDEVGPGLLASRGYVVVRVPLARRGAPRTSAWVVPLVADLLPPAEGSAAAPAVSALGAGTILVGAGRGIALAHDLAAAGPMQGATVVTFEPAQGSRDEVAPGRLVGREVLRSPGSGRPAWDELLDLLRSRSIMGLTGT